MRRVIIVLFPFLAVNMLSMATAAEFKGVKNPERVQYHWVMHCQGCHGADAAGSKDGAPNMAGVVARFLRNTQGREFLGRVPGVAFAPLSDNEIAELLNWMLQAFDAEHLPATFQPYSAAEVRELRSQPLVSETARKRREILQVLNLKERGE